MKISPYLFFLSVFFFVCSACSKDDVTDPIVGDWQLTSWTIGVPFVLSDDTTFYTNLLDETKCEVNETLSFDKNGVVTSDDTFNPQVKVSLMDGTSDTYILAETCAEGTIGFTTEYTHINDQSIGFNQVVGIMSGKQLTVVYKDAIKVYSEALTEVIETKDLTLVYEKK